MFNKTIAEKIEQCETRSEVIDLAETFLDGEKEYSEMAVLRMRYIPLADLTKEEFDRLKESRNIYLRRYYVDLTYLAQFTKIKDWL